MVAVANAADLVRIASGAYSAGTSEKLALPKQCSRDQPTQPGNPQKSNSEKEVEQEEHHRGDYTGIVATVPYCPGQDSHAGTLAAGGEKHEFATAQSDPLLFIPFAVFL